MQIWLIFDENMTLCPKEGRINAFSLQYSCCCLGLGLNMGQKRVRIEPLGHKIADVDSLSVVYLFAAYGRFALRHGLHRSELELLVVIDTLCGVNSKRLGVSLTCIAEVVFTSGRLRTFVTQRVGYLITKGYLVRSEDAGVWQVPKGYKPASLSLTTAGRKLLQLLPLEIEEQQKRIDRYHLTLYKS